MHYGGKSDAKCINEIFFCFDTIDVACVFKLKIIDLSISLSLICI